MSCTPCTKAQPLPTCPQVLSVGTIANVSIAVYIYFTKLSTGRTERFSGTSNADGVVTVDVTEKNDFFQPGTAYEMWVNLQTDENLTEKKTLTFGEETAECLLLRFVRVGGASYESIEIELL